ncbi:HAD family hydrolase [Planctobacterium marinum]|uniref:HAD family hydrolase n=1 Tax=Planctobacterium marinum TaxID=1631968 RepID=UPI001E3EEFE9|nr:HAD-IA family hydrolase [Planctobacterium marinum]MCC2604150.1 HAD-IA family hydrolase [Planctobacterium marinum]
MIAEPRGILFDLDGTLLDTAPDLGNALNHILKQLNYPEKSYDEYRVESSNGAIGMLKMGLGDNFDKFDTEELREKFLQSYAANVCRDTRPFEGIESLIKQIDAQHIPWGIVTNKPGFLTQALLAFFPVFKRCQVCFSGDSFANRKPHPEPLLKAAETLNVAPQSIWYVGDAERDMEAAQAAGMVAVLARYGYLTPDELARSWDVDLSVDSPHELCELLPGV